MIFLLFIGDLSETRQNHGHHVQQVYLQPHDYHIYHWLGTNVSSFLSFLYASCISETAFSLVPISGGIKVVTIGTYRPSSKSDLLFLLFLDQDWLLWKAEEFISTSKCKCKIAPATISTNSISVFLQIQPHYFFKFNCKSQLSEREHEQKFTSKDFPDLWPLFM